MKAKGNRRGRSDLPVVIEGPGDDDDAQVSPGIILSDAECETLVRAFLDGRKVCTSGEIVDLLKWAEQIRISNMLLTLSLEGLYRPVGLKNGEMQFVRTALDAPIDPPNQGQAKKS